MTFQNVAVESEKGTEPWSCLLRDLQPNLRCERNQEKESTPNHGESMYVSRVRKYVGREKA